MHRSKLHILAAALLIGGMLALPRGAAAQFGNGQKYFGAHVGMSGVGSAPAFGVSGEIAYNDRIGLGAWADTWSYGESFGSAFGSSSWDVRYIALAGTGSYHFPIESKPKLDPFLGLALGYFMVSTEATNVGGVTYGGDASRMFVGGFGGARYFFRENLSGVARVGFGASYLTLGVDFKL
ncbi:MAG: hypothetical protein ACRELX_11765 [Longimicrobiales bacterium]